MARSRNIKPGFFTNDALAELPALTRLFFIGLWTLVDRDGRIEDRPKKLKAEAMPYDDMDADAALSQLEAAGFVVRYAADGIKCVQVVNWNKHQNPHVKEQPSSLPAPDKNSASTGQAPDKQQPKPEVAGLIPSLLIPDSLKDTHTPLALDWALPKAWGEWAIGEFSHWTPEVVRSIASQFADHQRSKAAESADWPATWRKWCRDDLTQKAHPAPKPKAEKVAQPVGITVPSTDTGAQKFAAEMAERAATAAKPPASLVALVRRPQGEAA